MGVGDARIWCSVANIVVQHGVVDAYEVCGCSACGLLVGLRVSRLHLTGVVVQYIVIGMLCLSCVKNYLVFV